MSKTLWIVGGGIETIPGVQIAKEMGLHVVVSDMNPKAPSFEYADDYVIANTYDAKETVAKALSYHQTVRPIDGVICIASDIPVTVAEVAKALKLPGISVESAQLAADKMAMKDQFKKDNVAIPWYKEIYSVDELKKAIQEIGYPIVIKPVDSRGARGVLKLTDKIDLDWAFKLSKSYSPTERVMVEQFLDGPQISTESLIVDGIAHTPGFSDRNYKDMLKYEPFIIEDGGELPSVLDKESWDAVKSLVEKGSKSMGIKNGVVKGDIVVCQGVPHIIELAARLSGGYFCSHEIPLNTGVHFVKQAIYQALGNKPSADELKPKFLKGVAQRYIFPKPGKVVDILGVEEVSQQSGIAMCEIRVKIGDEIGPIHNHPGRAGVIISTAETREKAIEIAENAVKSIIIKTT